MIPLCRNCIEQVCGAEDNLRAVSWHWQSLGLYDLGESCQVALDEYRNYYNHSRPHQALGYLAPADVIQAIKLGGFNQIEALQCRAMLLPTPLCPVSKNLPG